LSKIPGTVMTEINSGEPLRIEFSGILKQLPFLQKHESPFGKCDDWNEQFVRKVLGEGFEASVIGEPNLRKSDKRGNIIGHHAIAVGMSSKDNSWFAADLSAGQISGHDGPWFQQAGSLAQLTEAVKTELGGTWKALEDEQGLRQEMHRQQKIYSERRLR